MKTIIFEDTGQDFLEWDIDEIGVVVACRPFSGLIWNGTRVREVCVGLYPRIILKQPIHGTRRAILHHRVVGIEEAA